MNRLMRALALSLSASAANAVGTGPQSDACERALSGLQARESELAAVARTDTPPRTTADPRWQALRREAARACLGHEAAGTTAPPAASPPLPHSALPPIAVPPVVVTPAPAQPAATPEAAQRRAPGPWPGYKGPPFVTSCDPLGCWTSDGARLPHTGRNPLDARVRCSVQGQLVWCL